jgi:cation transporter-like permease
MSHRNQIVFGVKAILLLAIVIHWQFFARYLATCGVPISLIPIAMLVHVGVGFGVILVAMKLARSKSRGK